MRPLYTFGIRLYELGIRIAANGNKKARQMVAGWKQSEPILRRVSEAKGERRLIWFHASSLGEFEQARPVLEHYRSDHPDHSIIVTFFSPSGYEIRKHYDQADAVAYLPMDTPENARRWVEIMKPDLVFFIKYDFWFNYLNELRQHKIPTYIFSAIFRPKQYFFRWYGRWFCQQLHCFTHLFVQNEESLQLLQKHKVTQCSIAGDTRFDRVEAIAREAKPNPVVEAFVRQADGVVMAGSSWEPDEERLKQFDERHSERRYKMVIAPHIIEEKHLRTIETLFGAGNCVRYTQLERSAADDCRYSRRVLIVDTMGMLSSLYRYADVAYIGGGFGHGIHNILEALTFGKPVVFGPRHQKFQEAKDIIALGGGFAYRDVDELEQHLSKLLWQPDYRQHCEEQCRRYVQKNIGSTGLILNAIEPLIRQ